MQKRLSQIISSFDYDTCTGPQDPVITDMCFDSRAVRPGSLFFALPGTHVHGNTFIAKALAQGAAAVVYQDELPQEAADAVRKLTDAGTQTAPVLIRVKDARFAMSPAADVFYDSPSAKLAVIGVTGTEGKSSTVSFIWQLLRLCGKKAGFISTVQYSLGDQAIANPEHQTTPEAPIVQRQLYEMVQNGCSYAVVESSSHGLSHKTNRLGNVRFDAGVFMNVTHEHLEFHGTHEQYKSDKANLFRALDAHDHIKSIGGTEFRIPSFGVVNLEDPAAAYFKNATVHPVYGFTTHGRAGRNEGDALPPIPDGIAYFSAEHLSAGPDGIEFEIAAHNADSTQRVTQPLHAAAPLPGAFNAYNILASLIAVSSITGVSLELAAHKCPQLEPVKGRMTVVDKGQPFEVIVDYAHTPSSFETIFPPIRSRAKGRIIVLFGSGGERDTKKRPEQGRIAAHWCHTVILADEDPRGEDPIALLEMIAEGCRAEGKTEANGGLYIIPPRPDAVRKAFALAQPGDIVLLLGKAHENSIIYTDYTMPYDEITEAEKALAEKGFTGRTGGGSL